MSTLTEKLISILERDRGGPITGKGFIPGSTMSSQAVDPDAEKPNTSILISDKLRYAYGTVFVRGGKPHHYPDGAAIIVRTKKNECMLVCLPSGNRWSDEKVFIVAVEHAGPTIEEFHREFGDEWQVSRRGKEALEEWARTDV